METIVYNDHDTDRVRNTQAQQLQPGQQVLQTAPSARQRNNFGMGLIGVGVLLLMGGRFFDPDAIVSAMIMATIASTFLFFGLTNRIYGLLIPGSILLGIAAGIPFEELTNGASIVWGLALGFFGIEALSRTMLNKTSKGYRWPRIPGVILSMVGVIILLESMGQMIGSMLTLLPLALIGGGVYIMFGRSQGQSS